MSWIVNWNGREYDADPTEFSGIELKMMKERTGFSCLGVIKALCQEQDGDALRVLFWIIDRRKNQDLKFTDYAGPSLRVVLPHLDKLDAALLDAMGDLGKAKTATQTTGTSGGPGSPSSTQPSEIDTLMIDLTNVTGTDSTGT